MTEEKYLEIKDSYLSNIKRYIADMGGVFPHITVFGAHKDEEAKDAIVHIPIPDNFMKSEETKEDFVQDVIPAIADKIRERFVPYGVAFTSEAWVRKFDKDEIVPDNWKEHPIDKEVLLVTMEFEHKKEALIYEIKRLGKQVNDDGELTDQVELIEEVLGQPDDMSGRFMNLLRKFQPQS